MSGDRSLDEFAGGDEESEPESESVASAADEGAEASAGEATAGGRAADDSTADDPTTDDDTGTAVVNGAAVEPATPTMRHTPGGAPCENCGERVERRWHDDGAFVCADCKAW